MKKLIVLIPVLIAAALQAQFVYDYLKAADNYYKKGDYYSASVYYEKYLNAGSDKKLKQPMYAPYTVQGSSKKSASQLSTKQQAVYNLAESYRKLNYHVKAEPHYKETLSFEKSAFPLAKYHYASTLKALGKYDEAETAFNEFIAEYTNEDDNKENAKRELQNLSYIREQMKKKDLAKYTVVKSAPQLNTTGASYAPTWMGSSLLFTSTRPDTTTDKKGIYTNRVYLTDMSAVNKLGLTQAANTHQGTTALTPDGNTLFITSWSGKGDDKNAAIYRSTKSGNGWSDPALVEAPINEDASSSQQPSVSPDGKYLYFSSNRAGGEGGFDLYMASIAADGKISNPVNLGKTINTKHDEQAPYYHAASGMLIFSTNGRIGMGGHDFFFSKGTPGNWGTPENFGYPVNSVKDDMYMVSRGGARNMLEDVILSSDRSSECCLELFSLKKRRDPRKISGIVLDCDNGKPVSGASVVVMDTVNNKTITTLITGDDGGYSLTLEDYSPLKLIAEKGGYEANSLHFYQPADPEEESMKNADLCIDPVWPPKEGEAIVLENIYFDFDKADLRPESSTELDKVVKMMVDYPNLNIEIGAHTDNKGKDEYNQKLSEKRAQAVVDYLTSKGVDAARLKAMGYGETQPVAENANPDGSDNPEGRQKNRRTEFKVIKQ